MSADGTDLRSRMVHGPSISVTETVSVAGRLNPRPVEPGETTITVDVASKDLTHLTRFANCKLRKDASQYVDITPTEAFSLRNRAQKRTANRRKAGWTALTVTLGLGIAAALKYTALVGLVASLPLGGIVAVAVGAAVVTAVYLCITLHDTSRAVDKTGRSWDVRISDAIRNELRSHQAAMENLQTELEIQRQIAADDVD